MRGGWNAKKLDFGGSFSPSVFGHALGQLVGSLSPVAFGDELVAAPTQPVEVSIGAKTPI